MPDRSTRDQVRYAAAAHKLRLSKLMLAEIDRLDISTYALAKAAGLPEQTVRDVVAGATDPRSFTLTLIERALGRPPGWVMREVG